MSPRVLRGAEPPEWSSREHREWSRMVYRQLTSAEIYRNRLVLRLETEERRPHGHLRGNPR